MEYSLWVHELCSRQLRPIVVRDIQQRSGMSLTMCKNTIGLTIQIDAHPWHKIWRVRTLLTPKTQLEPRLMTNVYRWTTAVGHQYTDVSASGLFDLSVFAS